MTNKLLQSIASFFILVLTAELFLAVKGADILTVDCSSNLISKSEHDFIINIVGWGIPGNHWDSEDPEVYIKVWKNNTRESRMNEYKKTNFKVAFLGCSFTFGTGVEARDTMVWRLNDKYSDVTFDNWGVSGWGTAQMYLRMQDLLSREKYDLIVYNAIFDHMFRTYKMRALGNLNVHSWYVPIPYANWDIFGRFRLRSVYDQRWPFESDLLSVNYFKRAFYGYKTAEYENRFSQKGINRNHDLEAFAAARDCYAEQVNRMYELCRTNKTDFLVCVLEDYTDLYTNEPGTITHNPGIRCELINIEMPDGQAHNAENRVLNNPSFHPNKNVHKYWADRFSEWLDKKYGNRVK